MQCLSRSPKWRASENQPGVNIRVSIHIYCSFQREEHFIHRFGWWHISILWGRSEGDVLSCMNWSYWFLRAGRWIVFVYNSCFHSVYLRNNAQSVDGWTYGMNQQQLGPIYSYCTTFKQCILWYHSWPHTPVCRHSHVHAETSILTLFTPALLIRLGLFPSALKEHLFRTPCNHKLVSTNALPLRTKLVIHFCCTLDSISW